MVRNDLLQVDRIKFKLVSVGQWAHNWYMRHIFFSKICANAEPYKHLFPFATSTDCLT